MLKITKEEVQAVEHKFAQLMSNLLETKNVTIGKLNHMCNNECTKEDVENTDRIFATVFTNNGESYTDLMNMIKHLLERYTMFDIEEEEQ